MIHNWQDRFPSVALADELTAPARATDAAKRLAKTPDRFELVKRLAELFDVYGPSQVFEAIADGCDSAHDFESGNSARATRAWSKAARAVRCAGLEVETADCSSRNASIAMALETLADLCDDDLDGEVSR